MEPIEQLEPFDPIDPQLHAAFAREHAHVPDEPFSGALLRRIAAERRRTLLAKRVLQVAGLAAVVVLSPRLVAVSQSVSAKLDALFSLAEKWLATPVGMLGASLCAVAVLAMVALRRRPSPR
jgi:hypothetical protein